MLAGLLALVVSVAAAQEGRWRQQDSDANSGASFTSGVTRPAPKNEAGGANPTPAQLPGREPRGRTMPSTPSEQEDEELQKSPAPTKLNDEDARMNFASVVETFIGQRSPEGFWPLRDKKSGKRRKLQLVKIDEKRVALDGDGRYKGPVHLKDLAEGGKVLVAEFVVDLTGAQWRVIGMRLTGSAPPAATADKKARPRQSVIGTE